MLSLSPHLNPTSVFLPCKSPQSPAYHVFFITGNPGCIGYYHTFLSLLAEHASDAAVNFYGHSLANFVDEARYNSTQRGVLGLQEQISYMEELLECYVRSISGNMKTDRVTTQPKVILVGHSVGAYIALEILRRRKESKNQGKDRDRFYICGFVGLWPTVTWIGESPSGKKLGVGYGGLQYSVQQETC